MTGTTDGTGKWASDFLLVFAPSSVLGPTSRPGWVLSLSAGFWVLSAWKTPKPFGRSNEEADIDFGADDFGRCLFFSLFFFWCEQIRQTSGGEP